VLLRKDILTQLGEVFERSFLLSIDLIFSLSVLPGRNRVKIIQKTIQERPRQGELFIVCRKIFETVTEALQKSGNKAKYYHAGMPLLIVQKVQDAFLSVMMQVIVATIALNGD
jgi:ATP-dependent DNA helicase RecQ